MREGEEYPGLSGCAQFNYKDPCKSKRAVETCQKIYDNSSRGQIVERREDWIMGEALLVAFTN